MIYISVLGFLRLRAAVLWFFMNQSNFLAKIKIVALSNGTDWTRTNSVSPFGQEDALNDN